jgi:hypothetical protein
VTLTAEVQLDPEMKALLGNLVPHLEAARFIAALTGSGDAAVTFQTFTDVTAWREAKANDGDFPRNSPVPWSLDSKGKPRDPLARVLHGTRAQRWDELVDLNSQGAGIFIMVNEGDLQGRTAKNVRAPRALFVEDDSGTLTPAALGLAPSIVVQSKKGLHIYWRLRPGEALSQFTPAQAALAAALKTDPVVKDPARVLRVPGFFHMKNRADIFPVRIVQVSDATYTIDEVLEGNGATLQPERPPEPASRANVSEAPAGDPRFLLARARAWLAKRDPAKEPGRNDAAFKAACGVRDFGISQDEVLDLMKVWNKSNVPLLPEGELKDVVADAFKYAKGSPGSKPDRPRNDATGSAAPPRGTRPQPAAEAPDELAALNEKYFIIEEGGKHFVACEWLDPMRKRRALKRYTFEEFRKRLLGQVIVLGEGRNRRVRRLADAWLEWERRRQYLGGVVFDPAGTTQGDVFNLWRGWPIEPAVGDWTIIREHIRDVLCGGDGDLNAYVVGWLRRLVQRPDQPGEVVLVFRGLQGSGKTILGNAVRRMFGQHALAVASPRAVVGQFNAHLRDLVFLLANEAVFAGDRASTSVLKSIATDETLFIEQKGIDVVEVPNFLHIMMTTNADWAVPVARDDRRFAVFDVSRRRVGNRSYFRDVYAAVNNDAVIGAMLFDLLDAQLDGFEVRDIPETSARHEQMVHSLEGEQAWLFHVLGLGTLGAGATAWSPWASTRVLQESHEVWARNGKYRNPTDPVTLGKYLARFFRSLRPRKDNPDRERGYWLGSLDEARAQFCKVMSLPANVFPDDVADVEEA